MLWDCFDAGCQRRRASSSGGTQPKVHQATSPATRNGCAAVGEPHACPCLQQSGPKLNSLCCENTTFSNNSYWSLNLLSHTLNSRPAMSSTSRSINRLTRRSGYPASDQGVDCVWPHGRQSVLLDGFDDPIWRNRGIPPASHGRRLSPTGASRWRGSDIVRGGVRCRVLPEQSLPASLTARGCRPPTGPRWVATQRDRQFADAQMRTSSDDWDGLTFGGRTGHHVPFVDVLGTGTIDIDDFT